MKCRTIAVDCYKTGVIYSRQLPPLVIFPNRFGYLGHLNVRVDAKGSAMNQARMGLLLAAALLAMPSTAIAQGKAGKKPPAGAKGGKGGAPAEVPSLRAASDTLPYLPMGRG